MATLISGNIRSHKVIGTICLLSIVLGAFYIFLIPAGLPYDEPAHWDIVQHYTRGEILPVMGAPGVSYEAYQPPLFYALGGLLGLLTGQLGEIFSFYALRLACLLCMVPIIYCIYFLANRVFGTNRRAVLLSTLFVAFNPVLLAITSSVQNDGISIALSLILVVLAVRCIGDAPTDKPLSNSTILCLGTLCALAILSKLTNAYLVIALPLYTGLLRRNLKETIGFCVIYLLPVLLLTSWWFSRNHTLYNDWTSASAMKTFFPEGTGQPVTLLDWKQWIKVLQNILNYHWLPSEYLRNTIAVPSAAKILVVLCTLSSLGGWLFFAVSRKTIRAAEYEKVNLIAYSATLLITICYALCLATYARNLLTEWILPARMLLVVMTAPVLFFIAGWEHWNARIKSSKYLAYSFIALLAITYCLIHFYILRTAPRLPAFEFNIRLSS